MYKEFHLEKIIFMPNSHLERIGPYAFSFTEIETFDAPESLTEIGDAAFFKCDKLASVNLGTGLKKLGNMCFWGTRITARNIPCPHNYLLKGDCVHPRILAIPEELREIKDNSFAQSRIMKVIIPDSV